MRDKERCLNCQTGGDEKNDDYMQHVVLEKKNDIGGKAGETHMRFIFC